MSTHKYIDKICCVVLAIVLLVTVLFMNGEMLGIKVLSSSPAYEQKLFDTSKVHTIDIYMDDWDSFIETCTNEEYTPCTVIIDGETYKNVALRAKGNTSLSSVKSYDNDRYSFKIEFDGYDSGKTYHGLDKLCLNNVIQDNTYMKDYLVYRMMNEFGAAAPLASYAAISVNGEYFGLYLAVEGVEDSFLERNYGNDHGNLYKPDSMSMGGGRGNGKDFDPSEFESEASENAESSNTTTPQMPGGNRGGMGGGRGGMGGGMPGGGGRGGMGSSDVSLIYTDDEFESYSNIFDSAKTDITDADRERLIASLKSLNENTDIENTVDVEAVIRYFIVHNFAVNFDSYTGSMIHNYYLYEENGILAMLPWDYNLAFGGFESRSDASSLVNFPIDSPVSGGTTDSRPMLAWIFESEEYTALYHKLFDEFITSYFDSGKFEEEIDAVYEMISPYVENDPTKFCTYEEFQSGISTLREFCLLRAESISGQLDGSIPSTSEGQSADTSALIDAGDLSVPAMGSMGHGGGMGGGFSHGDMPVTGRSEHSDTEVTSESSSQAQASSLAVTKLSSSTSDTDNMPMPPSCEGFPGRGGMPGGGIPQRGGPRGGFDTENTDSSDNDIPTSPDFPQGDISQQMTPPTNREGMQPPGMQFGGEMQNSAQSSLSSMNSTLTLLSVSVLVLIIGLFIAFKFKR